MPVYHTSHLQLCDLAESDAAISQLLQQAPVPPTPSEAYGWFTYSSNQQLQQAMQLRYGVVMKVQLEKLGKQEQQQPQQQQEEEGEQAAGRQRMCCGVDCAARGTSVPLNWYLSTCPYGRVSNTTCQRRHDTVDIMFQRCHNSRKGVGGVCD